MRHKLKWLKQIRDRLPWTRNLAVILIIAAVISAMGTYVLMTRSDSTFGPNPEMLLVLGIINIVLLLALIVVVVQRALKLWWGLKQGSVGSRLQTRIVRTFCLVTIIPTVTVAVFAAFYLNAGIKAWFSEKVNTGLEESVAVAEAYLNEHRAIIQADVHAIASDVERAIYEGYSNPNSLQILLSQQVNLRSLNEAAIIQRGNVLARTALTFSLAFEQLPAQTEEFARNGQTVVVADDDKIRAIVKLSPIKDMYLIVGRLVDERVVKHMENAQSAVNEYRHVRRQLANIQIQFSVMFMLVALLLVLAAVWYGMYFAARLVVPISQLVEAAERVRGGDYATRVNEGPEDDELATLGRAFNRMTNQLASQRRDLMRANRQIDNRRRFSEAVLAGVSAGVMALDTRGVITLHNRSAAQLLQMGTEEPAHDIMIGDVLPELESVLAGIVEQPERLWVQDITISRGKKLITLHMRISLQECEEEMEGYILTFDDITPLVQAQRNAAWGDVARRVAHEIKNPLTPIQLSAQRLKKKFLQQVDPKDHESFTRYTDTIVRHVADIGNMVEEFVQFARLPTPKFSYENLNDLLTKIVFSEETSHPNITYCLDIPEEEIMIECDAGQVRQVMTNLVKNAAEAIEARLKDGDGGIIEIFCDRNVQQVIIEIKDNGSGFPSDNIDQVLEPYVTTRTKGTGLGLAIVKKIMEDHKGKIELENKSEGGALVRLVFPLKSDIPSIF